MISISVKFQLFMAISGQLLTKLYTLILYSHYIIVTWGWFRTHKRTKKAFVHYGFGFSRYL